MTNKPPPGSGACCLPSVQGLTYLKIGPRGNVTGMQYLEVVFQQLYMLGCQAHAGYFAEQEKKREQPGK